MPKKHLAVNEEDITIERCPHDRENPYTMVHNELIRDASISPECRWLVIYLLSHKQGWRISFSQVMAHLNPHKGRDRTYQIFNEAIDAGYMKKEQIFRKNKRGGALLDYKYIVSEIPKFKKCYRLPENQDTGDQDTGDQYTGKPDTKEEHESKKEHEEKKNYEKEDTSLKVSSDTPIIAPTEPADAGIARAVSSPKPKKVTVPKDFSPTVKDLTAKMLSLVKEVHRVYRPPADMNGFHESVRIMVEDDQQNIDDLLETFEWACRHNEKNDQFSGWQAVICRNTRKSKPSNPAENFRLSFESIWSQMKAKTKRLFAPSSNDAASLKKLQAWYKDSI